jgi:hypothetical protein
VRDFAPDDVYLSMGRRSAAVLGWGAVVEYLREAFAVVAEGPAAVLVEVTVVVDDDREVVRRARISIAHPDAPVVTIDAAVGGAPLTATQRLLEAAADLEVGALVIEGEDVVLVRHRLWRQGLGLDALDEALLAVLADAWSLEQDVTPPPETIELFAHLT